MIEVTGGRRRFGALVPWAWAPLLVIFGVGLVLTTVRARTNSLAASWIVHFSYNATLFAVLFYLTNGFQHLERLAE